MAVSQTGEGGLVSPERNTIQHWRKQSHSVDTIFWRYDEALATHYKRREQGEMSVRGWGCGEGAREL